MRVDAHQHYWRFDHVRDAWITSEMAVLRRDLMPGDVAPAMAACGIDAVIAVQADQSEAETDFLLALASEHRAIRGVVGWVDLRAPDLAARVARWSGSPVLKGFRHVAQSEADDFLARPDVIRGVQQLGALGYAYDLLVYPRQLRAATALVAACEGVTFVLDHGAKPPIAAGSLGTWARDVRALARHPHVVCKLSGFVTEAAWASWNATEIVPCLDLLADAFGPERLMFGSDWPVCLLAAEYARVHDLVAEWSARLSSAERARLFGGTAASVYRLHTGIA